MCSRITLNSRLATAAAAIVQRIISRSKPRVFRPVSPFRNGSIGPTMDVEDISWAWKLKLKIKSVFNNLKAQCQARRDRGSV